ncbi:HIT domain-containing protein [Arenimonas caeni]|jgi:diadenosine tetraphosphate (Ap4A) HIT family hydrolase|uniref:Diadenosine tetraphosphate hydrolase n=1 Tax=Arenimonas caeni TaxID=2058085 RepID=A0A2P6M5N4_9GAMM|nr:HIT family protein [Arenimonas caeni]MDY0022488.1 HIT family protein [Arenimonas caeni]PRH81296.1 diadenosine tetraphosphate hydrolase [Arenimonas caeni]
MADAFSLDPRLAGDSVLVADGPLSQLRLMDDARFPWLVLVPRVPGAEEWIDLSGDQQRLLLAEVNLAGRLLRGLGPVHKLNIGALGNIVRQLHVHVLARQEGDAAWPGPAWGAGQRQPYVATVRDALVSSLRQGLADLPGP